MIAVRNVVGGDDDDECECWKKGKGNLKDG